MSSPYNYETDHFTLICMDGGDIRPHNSVSSAHFIVGFSAVPQIATPFANPPFETMRASRDL
jgi:hypothetical protein